MKEKLIGLQVVRDVFLEKGVRMSYGKVYYLVKLHPTFPKPVYLPCYKKPKWRREEVERWVEAFIVGKNQDIKKED